MTEKGDGSKAHGRFHEEALNGPKRVEARQEMMDGIWKMLEQKEVSRESVLVVAMLKQIADELSLLNHWVAMGTKALVFRT